MQLFTCPCCSLREEIEFHFCSEASNLRSNGDVLTEGWVNYLYMRHLPKKTVHAVSVHMACG